MTFPNAGDVLNGVLAGIDLFENDYPLEQA